MGFSSLLPYQQNLGSQRGPQRDHPTGGDMEPFLGGHPTFDTKRSTLLGANNTQYTGRGSQVF